MTNVIGRVHRNPILEYQIRIHLLIIAVNVGGSAGTSEKLRSAAVALKRKIFNLKTEKETE